MKKLFLSVFFLALTSSVFSQIIIVYIDTAKHFEHFSDISTPDANRSGEITWLKTYRFFNEKIISFDLDRKIQVFEETEFPITVIHETDNILDIEVFDNGFRKLVFLGKNKDGSITYLEEYFQDGKTKGFFSINPEYTISEAKRFYINN
jgi:hypothetical protein